MSHALSIQQLTCCYDTSTVLDDLSFDVEPGEIVCLLGASGCGKTTLLKAIAGLLPLTHGMIALNGRVVDDGVQWVSPEKRNIGMIFQDYALFPHLDVSQNIAFGLKGYSSAEKKHTVKEMLKLVHLEGLEARYPHQLSGGQQQRVAIARSLAYQPDLLLLDEPFSNIDTQVRHDLIAEIRKIFKKQGITAIFVTHSREEAFAFADRMAVMNHGIIEQYGSASELYFRPSSKFVADFLGGGSYLPAKRISEREYETILGNVAAITEHPIGIGTRCDLLLRPQHVRIEPAEHGAVHVLEQQFMGDHCRYLVEINGIRLLATSRQAVKNGHPVTVHLEPEGIIAFSQEN
ncbi:ABC transporter ATP-binding protein [Vibrio mangrovi]|uniref:ABC transporter ATP-binding protein n=1 Tax=Vibrio mangrovi TaxID=474394 RepID=A0A1Y6IUG5_9VIBR|nr:ABC transporter ATP-binding protein [Vibrio mangrovi]MDW6003052.1 ABC transporter ATP-binding protein [Vibrio mangrovi]SMS01294.1 Fe(3+) ions import ATP-binding protein FbpC [Vibrio mangrovi]